MTRINLVRARFLADQHLIAEIKEINQLAGSFRKSSTSKQGFKNLPINFTLNQGHVRFFYDKGLYLQKRFEHLKEEALYRGFDVKAEFQDEWTNYPQMFNDWEPVKEDIRIVVERIIDRVCNNPKAAKKDSWYKYSKRPITNLQYKKLLEENI